MDDFSYGVSFSAKYAKELGLDWQEAYEASLNELNFDRLRLMSYWNDIQPSPGKYDFKELDWQIEQARKYKTNITLCVGMRQPRWPECHIPGWAKELPKKERQEALYKFLEKIVERYRDEEVVESWQLENEALNKGIGTCDDYDRHRLRKEYEIVKKLDKSRPVIMSVSNTFGLPLRRPRPDIFGFSAYLSQYNKGKYRFSWLPAWYYKLRKWLIVLILRRPVIIHELQAEPWGPRATHELIKDEQTKSMDIKKLQRNINYAHRTGISHIDLWGVEWWYWKKLVHNDDSYWKIIQKLL